MPQSKSGTGVKDACQVSNGVAVIADSTWSAMQGRKALDIKWDEGSNANQSTRGLITRMFTELVNQQPKKPPAKKANAGWRRWRPLAKSTKRFTRLLPVARANGAR